METPKYISIYPIETAAKKISDMLDMILEQKPRLYGKTKARYNDLTVSLLSSVEKISKITQEDALSTQSDDEFNELASAGFDIGVDSALKSAQQEIAAAKSFSSRSDDNSFVDLKYIDTVFAELNSIDFGWKEVNHCARLLQRWYHSRFIEHPVTSCNYSYLGDWVHKFIIQFGYHCSVNSCDNFETSLIAWCDRLAFSDIKYAQPWFIFQTFKSGGPEEYTLQAVLINDMIYDKCLCKLTSTYPMFDSMEVSRLVKSKNPALTPKINSRFAKQHELIEFAKFSCS